ncbi:MAG: heavy-metal-associated domain-containing protein [Maricaulaceae bacterium]
MSIKYLFTLLLAGSFTPPLIANAQTTPPAVASAEHKTEIMTAKVNGMVCDFCAQAVIKVFSKEEGVEDVAVDLDAQAIIVTMQQGHSLDDERIKKLVRKSGYALVEINRVVSQL